MPSFLYRAIDLDNRRPVDGLVEAIDDRAARAQLRARGVLPLSIAEVAAEAPVDPRMQAFVETLTFYPVKVKDLAIFTQQFAALVEAGIPLIDAMHLLEEQASNPSIRKALAVIRKDLFGGMSLSEALSQHPRIFNPLFINLVQAGEVSGSLDTMLVRLAGMIEASAELERKVKAALTYPALLAVTLTLVVMVIMVFVVPGFQSIYAKTGSALPLPTQVLLAVSGFLRTHIFLLLAGLVGLYGTYLIYRRSETGRPVIDALWLRAPLFGRLILEQQANTFARAFGTVYGAGVPIVPALESCRKLVSNWAIGYQIDLALDGVRMGRPLTAGLANSERFPKILAQMMAIGESSGRLEEMCMKAVAFSDKELNHRIQQMTAMLEPLLTIVMGLIVAGIALALYLPMFDLPSLLIKG
jgi:type IV pilus assembly protein PilC